MIHLNNGGKDSLEEIAKSTITLIFNDCIFDYYLL